MIWNFLLFVLGEPLTYALLVLFLIPPIWYLLVKLSILGILHAIQREDEDKLEE